MPDSANKTFYKFLLGFLSIIAFSFTIIIGTTFLSEQNATQHTASPTEEIEE